MKTGLNWWTRKLHRWGAIVTAVPMLLVILTGLLLQLKKEVAWVQPPTQKGSGEAAQVSWEQILKAAQAVPEAEIKSWEDIDRLDVRPGKSLVKIQAVNQWELQIDWTDGKLLSSTYRRSDWIETLHDGSFFGDYSKTIVFLANGLILLALWATGMYLWYLPIGVRIRKRMRKSKNDAN